MKLQSRLLKLAVAGFRICKKSNMGIIKSVNCKIYKYLIKQASIKVNMRHYSVRMDVHVSIAYIFFKIKNRRNMDRAVDMLLQS